MVDERPAWKARLPASLGAGALLLSSFVASEVLDDADGSKDMAVVAVSLTIGLAPVPLRGIAADFQTLVP